MPFDAVVLSGGRATRLGGTTKAAMLHRGVPLVVRAVEAASGAGQVVVVGDGAPQLPGSVRVIRESPAFSGPAAALGAGILELDRLRGEQRGRDLGREATDAEPDLVLVLACDMPNVRPVVGRLLTAAEVPVVDGAVAVDVTGRRQPLAAVYRRSALLRAISGRELIGMSMRDILSELRLREVPAAIGADPTLTDPTADPTADVDTWADAARLDVAPAPDQPGALGRREQQ